MRQVYNYEVSISSYRAVCTRAKHTENASVAAQLKFNQINLVS